MSHRRRPVYRMLSAMVVLGLLVPAASSVPAALAAPAGAVKVSAPATSPSGALISVSLSLPPEVAAIDGRVFLKDGAGEVVGVATTGKATGLRPEAVAKGFAFGAFDLSAGKADRTVVTVVVEPLRNGRLQLRIVTDAAADRFGDRLDLGATDQLVTVVVGGSRDLLAAPKLDRHFTATRQAAKVREAKKDGKIDRQDLDIVRGSWTSAHSANDTCTLQPDDLAADVNDDGCLDIVDLQIIHASQGASVAATDLASDGGIIRAQTASITLAAATRTFVVTSPLDTADVAPGNGACADSLGRCTLRAAMAEADYLAGEDRIEFNLTGAAPVTIQLSGRLPMITSRSGGVTIDGYSQPGSSPNTATYGSNAVPGIELRGNGTAAREMALYITSPGNTIRGLLIGNIWRGIFIDGINAQNNVIVGNWIGFTRTQAASGGQYGIVLNNGSNRNIIGTPVVGDRNVIGNWGAGLDAYGPGTDSNIVQNNQFCIRPNGLTATCGTGIDHNFGPKNGLIGGMGMERNVFGTTTLQGIEYSHGYNPTGPAGTDFSITYQINNNRAIGNWVGFRADGSYDPAFRSGINFSDSDNGQGINVYDGANDNLVERNYVASVYDGIQTMAPTAARNIIRNNVIGESPLGQAAPLTRWGIVVRWGSTRSVVEGNTIKNAGAGGIGLLNTNNAGQSQSPAYNIKLTQNIITNTSGPAIDLFGVAGPDANDAGDADTGANTVLNTPVITSATTNSIKGTGSAGATVEVYTASRNAGAFGLPSQYLGPATVASDGTWTFPYASNAGAIVSALQILPDMNTSEFAANAAVGVGSSEAPTITSASATTFVTGSPGSFTVTTTGLPTPTITPTGALPAGVTFLDNGNGTGTLSGTPAAGSQGSYPLTFTAANGVAPNATQTFTLTVNLAPVGGLVAADSFTRTVVGGWGTGDVGGPWTITNSPGNFSVNGTAGSISLTAGATRMARLGNVATVGADMRVDIVTDRLPAAGNLFYYLVARRVATDTEYRAKVRVAANGSVFVQPTKGVANILTVMGPEVQVMGLTVVPGTALAVRVQYVGSSPTLIRMRVWTAGEPEPTTWAASQSDSQSELQAAGAIGLRAYLGSSTTNAPVLISFDDLVVNP